MLPLLLHPAFAATWVVDPSGGGDFLSITAAVEAASDGDELQLAAASFVEDVALGGKSLTLTGAGSGTTWIFGTGTTIDARGAAEVTLS